MISENMARFLQTLETEGSMYLTECNEAETKAGRFSFSRRLRDFTDEEIRNIVKTKSTSSVAQLLYACEKVTDDEEIIAHIWGFENSAVQKAYEDKVMEMARGNK